MSGAESPRAQSLRNDDPTQLGPYRITGRLGEGGMGSVYLAAAPDGRLVALKVIRGELAHDAEFRRRFRSEVARAREVPPFCTAEVLDADTEHEPPYLVVEYVEGPSLDVVVRDRGPLTPANQHGLAVGVAVALTAIHGAGVIHRDLKPSNVLLAPGSPKVIDFGIARGAGPSDAETGVNQLVGTVPYMAPERFDTRGGSLTPASDIFSWGAVMAYAATGRSPFGAAMPEAVAVRIMTTEPDLDGLSGPLRDLVRLSLAKNPADRPTARQLLDSLLSGDGVTLAGGVPAPTRSSTFQQQPEVLAAAGIQPTMVLPSANATTVDYAKNATPVPRQDRPGSRQPGGPPTAYPTRRPPPMPPQRARRPAPSPAPRRGASTVVIVLLSLVVLLLGGTIAAYATGYVKLPTALDGPTTPTVDANAPTGAPSPTGPDPTIAPGSVVSPSSSPTANDPTVNASWNLVLDDAFAAGDTYWPPSSYPDGGGKCTVDGELTAALTKAATGAYRCQGIGNKFNDLTVKVDVEIGGANSCGGVWFRYSDAAPAGGYAAKICEDRIQLVTHADKTIKVLKEFYYPGNAKLTGGRVASVALRVEGSRVTVFYGATALGSITDTTFTLGRTVLGVFAREGASVAPYEATFHRVQIYEP
jgi:eukaryotic-like serine/threonine-protein kinase